MSLRLVTTDPNSSQPPTMADRFWAIATPPRPGDDDSVAIAEHLLAILDRFRQLERGSSGGEPTLATLSLVTLLRQQEAQGDLTYASPEQVRAEHVSERSLVFTVGVLLFERLCHRHPFGVDKAAIGLVRLRKAELGSSVNFLPKLPARLRGILTQALSPLPDERHADVDELASALRDFVREERRVPRLPGAPPAHDEVPAAAPEPGVMRSRRISEWERLSTDAGADELAAPSLEDILAGELDDDEDAQSTRRSRRSAAVLKALNGEVRDGADRPGADAADDDLETATTEREAPIGENAARRSAASSSPATSTRRAPAQAGAAALRPSPPRPSTSLTELAEAGAVPERLDSVSERTLEMRRPASSSPRHLPTALWFALGVGTATIAFAVWTAASSHGGDAVDPRLLTPPPSPKSAAASDGPSSAAPAQDHEGQPAGSPPADVPAPALAEPSVVELPPGEFDPDVVADEALAASRLCFDVDALERPLGFGLGILFEPGESSMARKIFFPVEAELDYETTSCLHEVMASVTAGGAPEHATSVELRITLGAGLDDAVVKRLVP